jgi:poly(A)-specific ribonuclease
MCAFFLSERYKKVLNGSSQFLVVQFGLSIFNFDKKIMKYGNKTYNFYIFPHTSMRGLCDKKFLSQASSLSFLANQGFDFNKLIKEGIKELCIV